MAVRNTKRGALRALAGLLAVAIAGIALIAGLAQWGDPKGQWTPRLGLDLEGGTEMVLSPIVDGNKSPTSEQINQALGIIRQRIDANGVSEAEISTLGTNNIVVAIPGQPTAEQRDAIRKPSQLRFRAVFVATPVELPSTAPTATGTSTGTATGTATSTGTPSATVSGGATTSSPAPASPTTAGGIVPPAYAPAAGETSAATGTGAVATPLVTATAPGATTAPGTATSTATGMTSPATATQTVTPAQIQQYLEQEVVSSLTGLGWTSEKATPAAKTVAQQYTDLDCTAEGVYDKMPDVADAPMATCGQGYKFILGPVEIDGADIADATSGFQPGPNGQPTSIVEVALSFKDSGKAKFAEVTRRLYALSGQTPKDQFAVVLDKVVITAPAAKAVITDGRASITGSFTIDSAKALAEQLKFGALPLSFKLDTQNEITPQLGQDQLRLGLLAGAIGLLLVIIYSLFQYRALGLVTVASLVVAASLTYIALTILGTTHQFRLTMAGVTGVIVAIGVTADSFIVYFERIRDEVREGRPLVAAVETGWKRARRTIIAADIVNIIAAVVLYLLASANVRGFAFTLGLTTIIDLLVVMMFTHPMVQLLARTEFFGNGHKWSGLDPERLGAKVSTRYRGRGQYLAPPRGAATTSATTSARTSATTSVRTAEKGAQA